MRARTQVMQRTYVTVAQNKIVSDWTLPKMILQAKAEQELERKKQRDRERRLKMMQDLNMLSDGGENQ